jgi:hypothetical protein
MKTIRVEITHRDRDILAQKVEDYYRGYHPSGYDTRMDGPTFYDEKRNVWVAVLTRLESCD